MDLPVFKTKKGISEKVADYLKEQIQIGEFSEGEKIFGEREMATYLDVSRNTVREAYKILEAYGYLKTEHGRGVFIASEAEQIKKMTESFFVPKSKIEDLYAVRKVLEESMVEWAIKNGTKDQFDRLDSIVISAKKVISSDSNLFNLAEYDLQFHLCIAEMSKNMVANKIMNHLIDLLAEARSQSIQIPNRAKQSVLEHEVIVNAMKKGDIVEAKEAINNHLESVERSINRNFVNRE